MTPEMAPILFAGFIVLIVVIGIASYIGGQKRKQALTELAQQMGFSFYPEGLMAAPAGGFLGTLGQMFAPTPDAVFVQRFGPMHPFGEGHSPDVDNLLFGSRNGKDWYLFDYSYKTESRDSNGNTSTTTHGFGIVAARIPVALPGLSLAPETVFHRIGHKLGLGEMNFELEEFNRRYFIRSGDQKLAYDLLHPQAIDFLMRQPIRHWQIGGFYVLLAQGGSYRVEDLPRVMSEIEGFIDLIPAYYRQDHGFTPNWRNPLD